MASDINHKPHNLPDINIQSSAPEAVDKNHRVLGRTRSLPQSPLCTPRSLPPSPLMSPPVLRSPRSPLRLVKDAEQPCRGSLRTLHQARDEDTEEEDEFPPLHEIRPRSSTCPDCMLRARAKKLREMHRPPSPPIPRSPGHSWSREHLLSELPRLQEDT